MCQNFRCFIRLETQPGSQSVRLDAVVGRALVTGKTKSFRSSSSLLLLLHHRPVDIHLSLCLSLLSRLRSSLGYRRDVAYQEYPSIFNSQYRAHTSSSRVTPEHPICDGIFSLSHTHASLYFKSFSFVVIFLSKYFIACTDTHTYADSSRSLLCTLTVSLIEIGVGDLFSLSLSLSLV